MTKAITRLQERWEEENIVKYLRGVKIADNEKCILKILKPVKTKKIKREVIRTYVHKNTAKS